MHLTIGILACDHVSTSQLDEYGDYHQMFESLVQADDHFFNIKTFDLIADQFPMDLSDCDAYIITGSKAGAYEDIPWIHKAKQLVKQLYNAKIPTIGICFGHQLIAEALGGKVIKAESKGRGLGVQTWRVSRHKQWMGVLKKGELSLNVCHQDQVVELPKNSELLLSSDFCSIAGFQTQSMLGIQGHPEFNQDYTKYLFDKYKDELNQIQKNTVENSFNQMTHSGLVGYWMVNFIKEQLNKV